MTEIPAVDITNRRARATERIMIAVIAFGIGVPTGALIYHAGLPPCDVVERTVPALFIKSGGALCGDWGGLKDVKLVGKDLYSFVCYKHAQFNGIEVALKQDRKEEEKP